MSNTNNVDSIDYYTTNASKLIIASIYQTEVQFPLVQTEGL